MYSQTYENVTISDIVAGEPIAYNEGCSLLQQKSRVDLEQLMNDNEQFDKLVNDLASVSFY